jgi:hypothetical protein
MIVGFRDAAVERLWKGETVHRWIDIAQRSKAQAGHA